MSSPRLYHELAHLWSALSPPEDYASEANMVRQTLDAYLPAKRWRVLELGAGAGHTLWHLADCSDAVAVDLSEQMLAHCKELNPEIRTVAGDMRDVRLGETFDAVLVHDAIDYMRTEADVAKALATAAAHLEQGGIAIIAPTYIRETFVEHEVAQDHVETDELVVTYFSYVHQPEPGSTQFELVLTYLIRAAQGGQLQIEHDRHQCGLLSEQTWAQLITNAGFEVHRQGDDAAVWFVGVKR